MKTEKLEALAAAINAEINKRQEIKQGMIRLHNEMSARFDATEKKYYETGDESMIGELSRLKGELAIQRDTLKNNKSQYDFSKYESKFKPVLKEIEENKAAIDTEMDDLTAQLNETIEQVGQILEKMKGLHNDGFMYEQRLREIEKAMHPTDVHHWRIFGQEIQGICGAEYIENTVQKTVKRTTDILASMRGGFSHYYG